MQASLAIALILLLLLTGAGAAANVSVEALLDPDRAHIGDPVSFTLKATGPAATEFSFGDLAEQLGSNWEITKSETETAKDEEATVVSHQYSILPFRTGRLDLAIPPVRFIIPDEGEIALSPPPLFLSVDSLIEDSAKADIRDIKPPLALRRPILLLAAIAGGVVLILLAVIAIRKRRRAGPAPLPLRSAEEIALEALEEIKRQDLPARGMIKEYYLEVSGVVRRYLENRFGLHAPERTTEEFLQELTSDNSLAEPHQQLLADFLTHCDLVKFARYGPSSGEIEGVYQSARRLVVETSRKPEPAAEAEKDKKTA
jgi:hypothetical protein